MTSVAFAVPEMKGHPRQIAGLWIILAGLGLYYFVAIALARALGSLGGWLAMGLAFVAGLWLILWRVELFFAVFVAFLLTFRYMVYYFSLPSQFDLLPVFLGFASILSLVRVDRVRRPRSGAFVLLLYGLFFVPWLIGALFTPASPARIGVSFAWRFHGLFLFVTAYLSNRLSREWFRKYVLLAAVILAIQLPIQILQYFNFLGSLLPVGANGVNSDYLSGTFGWLGTNQLGVFELGALYFVLFWGMLRRFSLPLIGLIALFFIPTLIGDIAFARFGLFAFPIVAVGLVALGRVTRLRRLIRYGVISLIVLPILILAFQYIGDTYVTLGSPRPFRFETLLSRERWSLYLGGEYSSDRTGRIVVGRTGALRMAFREMSLADGLQLFFGYGPDSVRVGRSSIGASAVDLPTKTTLYTFYGFDRLLLETGVLGTFLFLSLLAYLFLRVLRFVRRQPPGSDEKMLGIMYLGVWVVFVATGQFDGGWFEPFQKVMMFWLLTAGMLIIVDRVRYVRPVTDAASGLRRS